MHAKKLRLLRRWSFPWRKQDGEEQPCDHAVEHLNIQLFRLRVGLRGRWLPGWWKGLNRVCM